jgi:hypothetical protein
MSAALLQVAKQLSRIADALEKIAGLPVRMYGPIGPKVTPALERIVPKGSECNVCNGTGGYTVGPPYNLLTPCPACQCGKE